MSKMPLSGLAKSFEIRTSIALLFINIVIDWICGYLIRGSNWN